MRKRSSSCTKTVRQTFPAFLGLILATGASATDLTWSGGGGDDKFSTAANWGGTAPNTIGDSIIFDGAVRLTPMNDQADDYYTFTNITFNSGASPFTISGSRIQLLGGIGDNSANPQTLNNALALGANLAVNVASGSGALTNAGTISGAFALSKGGSGALYLTGTNTFTGAVSISGGMVSTPSIGTVGVASALGLGTSGTGNKAPIQLTGNNGKTLQYTGPGESSDREIYTSPQVGKYTTLDASGSGPLVLAGKLSAYIGNSSSGDANLVLTGSNGSDNALSGDMVDNVYNGNCGLAIIKQGSGTWSLQGTKHQKGRVDVENGVLKFDSIANVSSACSLGTAAKLYSGTTALGYAISLGTASTAGTLQYTGSVTNTTDRAIGLKGNGTISSGSAGGSLVLNGTITNLNGGVNTLTLAGSGTSTINGVIQNSQGTLNLIKSESGTWVLGTANTFSGLTTLGAGVLRLTNANALQFSALDLEPGDTGTLDLDGLSTLKLAGLQGSRNLTLVNGSGTPLSLTLGRDDNGYYIYSGVLSGGDSLTKNGNSYQSLQSVTFTGNTLINGGTLALQAGASLANSAQILVGAGATFDVSALGGFALNGAAHQVLGGSGTISGSVFAGNGATLSPGTNALVGGTLTFASDLTLGGGATNVFDLGTSAGGGISDVITVTGSLTLNGINTIKLNPYLGSLGVGVYPLFQYGYLASGGLANLRVLPVPGYTLSLTNDTSVYPAVIAVVVSGGHTPVNLTWKGNGTDNFWDATITADWLQGATSTVFFNNDSVTFDDSSTNQMVNLVGALAPAAIQVSNNTRDYTWSGSGRITGPVGLTKDGSRSLTILTANDNVGAATINAGTVQLGNGGASGWLGSSNIVDNGALVINRSDTNILAPLSGAGTLTQQGSGTTFLTNDASASAFSGNVNINGGTLAVSSEYGLGTGSQLNFGGGGMLQLLDAGSYGGGTFFRTVALNAGGGGFNHSADLTIYSTMTGPGPLNKQGAGTLIIPSAKGYSGGTLVGAGALAIDDDGALGTGRLTFNGTSLFRSYSGTQRTLNNAVTLAASITLGNSSDAGLTFPSGAWTLSGASRGLTVNTPVQINGAIGEDAAGLGLTKGGSATLTLAGASTFTGPVTINSGTLSINSLANAGSPSALGASVAGTGGNAPIRFTSNNGKALQYTGTGSTSDREIYINNQDGSTTTLDASGSGALVLNGPTNISVFIGNSSAGNANLVLTGSNANDNTLAGDIYDNLYNENCGLATVKQGTGTWSLLGLKHNKGRVDVEGGVLKFDSIANTGSPSALGTGTKLFANTTAIGYAISLNNAAVLQYTGTNVSTTDRILGLKGDGTLSSGSAGGALVLNGTVTNLNANANTLTLGGSGIGTINGVVQSPVGTLNLVKAESGTWILTAANLYTGTTTVNGGLLELSSAQAGTGDILVNDGATLRVKVSDGNQLAPGTLTLGSATGAASEFSGLSNTTTAPVNAGTVVLQGNNRVNVVGGNFVAGGTYPLITCATLSGGGNLALGNKPSGLVGTVVIHGSGPYSIDLVVTAFSADIWAAGNGTWDNGSANWRINGALGWFASGDAAVFDDTASGPGPFTVTVSPASVSPASITVSNAAKSYILGGNPIAGTGALTKSGNGTLVLAGANTYSGGTLINAGTLQLGNGGASGSAGTGPVVNNSLLVMDYGANDVTNASVISGSGTLAKNGSGTLTLSGANSFSGGISQNAGTLLVNAPTALGSGPVAVATNATLQLNANGNVNVNNSLAGVGLVRLNFSGAAAANTTLDGATNFNGAIELANAGATGNKWRCAGLDVSGATLQVDGGSQLYLAGGTNLFKAIQVSGSGNNEGRGAIRVGGATLASVISLQGDTWLGLENAAAVISGSIAGGVPGLQTLTVGTPNTSGVGTLSANLVDGIGTLAVVKTNTGALTLSGQNTYSGNTTVLGGKLALASGGVLANTPLLTVASNATFDVSALSAAFALAPGQTLSGNGTVVGPVLLKGTLAPGTAGLGVLTFSNGLEVAGNLLLKVNKSLAPSNDVVNVAGLFTNSGPSTLTLTNLGPSLAVNDSFQLFSQPLLNGNALTINGPAGVVFTNRLAVDGSVAVVSLVATASYPTNLACSRSGSSLSLSWPASHQGWIAQSNSVNVADTNFWFDLPGSQTGTNLSILVSPVTPKVFFRLRHP